MKYLAFTILGFFLIGTVSVFSQNRQSDRLNARINKTRTFSPFYKKPNKEQKKQLQPYAEDLSKYSQFLLQPNTGIFRLLPDLGCDDNALVLRVDEICRNAIPQSFSYSFREDEHKSDILADLRLKDELLISDGILSQGIFVKLGDVAVETVSSNTDGMKFLNDYVPQDNSKEAQKQFLEMTKGVKSGKYEYRKVVSAIPDTTYALRVIAYRGNIYRTYRGFLYNLLDGDKRMDITVAFRIIRKEADGSLTLLWKEIQRKDSPKIKKSKKTKK